ncbi:hypothetical protein FKP32DRAFT_1572940 [Trametes sanguinea]|nr:hypothetical protein FKP32DRAFT_1572940 [Trametes sanguinea]
MTCCTFFICDRVEFSASEGLRERHDTSDTWKSARVSITEIMDDNRWLMVMVPDQPIPVVWRALQDEWSLTCDESKLMCMQHYTAEGMKDTVQKLRFTIPRDFWTFMAHFMHGRLLAQTKGRTDSNWGAFSIAHGSGSGSGGNEPSSAASSAGGSQVL